MRRFIRAVSGFPLNGRSGLWTPTIQDTSFSDAESQVYSVQFGAYTKIGNRVFITGKVGISNLGSLTTSNVAYIAGLPFNSNSASNTQGSVSFGAAESLSITGGQVVTGEVLLGVSHIRLGLWDFSEGTTAFLVSELSVNGTLTFSGQYIT